MSGTQIVLSTTPEFLRATFDFRLSDKVLRIIVALRKFRCGTRKLITDKALRIIVALGVVLMKFMLKRLSYHHPIYNPSTRLGTSKLEVALGI